MDILGLVGGIFTSGGLGAIVGAVGSYFAKKEERKLLAEKHKYNLADRELDLREQAAEQSHAVDMADKKMAQTSLEGDIAVDVGELAGWSESIKNDAKSVGIMAVDAIRGLMRPLITTYLLIIVSILGWKLNTIVGGLESLPTAEVFALYHELIMSTVFLMTVSVTWWFGSRPNTKGSKGGK